MPRARRGSIRAIMDMKQLATTVALILLIIALPVHASSPAKKETINQLVKELSDAYEAKTLGKLDAEHPYLGKVKIIIEHSLGEGKDQFEVKEFKTLEKAEQWLKSREREDGTPFREIRTLVGCKRGICTYDFDGGILHNHLYIKKIAYGYRNRSPYIKRIYLLDGD